MDPSLSGKRRSGLWEGDKERSGWASTEEGEHESLYRPAGDGGGVTKKIPYRIAQRAARAAQYRSIYHHRGQYPVKAMCAFFGVSRAAYYAWGGRLEQGDRDQERMEQVQQAYEASHKVYGYRRVALWLRQEKQIVINHKTVLRLMNKLDIHSRARKRKMHRKLEELGTYHTYSNLLNRDFAAARPNQKWVTDVTYIMTQQGWC